MVYGFSLAFLCAVGQRFKLYDDGGHSGALWHRSVSVFVTVASLLGVASFSAFAWYCKSKLECNEIHPYIAFIPVRERRLED